MGLVTILAVTVRRQGKVKGGPLAHLSLSPDTSAVAIDDPFDDGQTDARSLELLRAMQSLENPEKFMGIPHVKSSAIVLDVKNRFSTGGLLATHLNPRHFALARVLEGIGQEVDKDLFQQGRVGLAGCGRRGPGASRRFVGQPCLPLPVGLPPRLHPGQPAQRPWVPCCADSVILGTVVLLPFVLFPFTLSGPALRAGSEFFEDSAYASGS